MQIQRTQKQNFGAIELLSLKKGGKATKEAYRIAKEQGVRIETGQTPTGIIHNYIQIADYIKEQNVLKALHSALARTDININKCSHQEAKENVNRFNKII